MTDDEAPEGTADNPADADAGDGGKEQLTPYRATKIAGIVVGTVLLCAAVVVAAVWVISEVVDEDDRYFVRPLLLNDYDDYYYDEGRSADDDRPKWYGEDRFTEPDPWSRSWRRDGGCEMPFGFGANVGPVVVLVVPGLGLGLGGLGGEPQGVPPDLAPFLEQEGWFGAEQWPGEWGLEGFFGGFAPEALGEEFSGDPADLLEGLFEGANLEMLELLGDLGLEVTESDNTASGDRELEGLESPAPT